MRIACLQFSPQVGDVDSNLNRADAILSRVDPKDLDLLVLPELAFTGYNFKSLQQIAPFLEPSESGITSLWARTTALKYECTVVTGYPEKVDPTLKWPTDPEYYNAAVVVSADGETSANYRKSHLYYTDETWALEGQGFFAGRLPGLGKTAIGICMDINPYKFQVPWENFEFAYHVLENSVRLVIVSMAWITQEEPEVYMQTPDEPDMDTLTYWLARLDPVIRAEPDHEIIVIFANRSGQEDNATYAGTSAVVGIKGKDVRVYGILGRGQKDLLVVDTEDPPYAKLVFRPTEKVKSAEEEATSSQESTQSASTDHQTQECSQDILDQTSLGHDVPSMTNAVHSGTSDVFQKIDSGTSPIRHEVTVHGKSDRRSTLVEFSPSSDGRSFFDEKGSPITPTYEEQYWWPSPFSQPTHRRYHSASSIGLSNNSSRKNRAKALQNRNSIGSALSDKTSTRWTKKWVEDSSISSRGYGGHGSAASCDVLLMEAVHHSGENPTSAEPLLDDFVKPSTLGFSALSINQSQTSSRSNGLSKKLKQRRVIDGEHTAIMTEQDAIERKDVEAWLSKSGATSGSSDRQRGSSTSSNLKKTRARKERPSYINDWDEPRSYSPMEFRTPRAMTFEEIGALTTPVST